MASSKLVDAAGIGAGDDDQVVHRRGRRRRRGALAHIASVVDERLAREMAAALGQFLVFELNCGRAGRFELDDRSFDVERLAEAGVGVDDQRACGSAR